MKSAAHRALARHRTDGWRGDSRETLAIAIEHLSRAVERDPEFALATRRSLLWR